MLINISNVKKYLEINKCIDISIEECKNLDELDNSSIKLNICYVRVSTIAGHLY